MNTTITDTMILLEVNEGCISCPFDRNYNCGCDENIGSSHDYTYPAKCPLLNKTVEVKRVE